MSSQSRANYDWGRWDSQHGDAARSMGWTIRWVEAARCYMLWTYQPPNRLPDLRDLDDVWERVLVHWHQPHCRAALEFMAEHNPHSLSFRASSRHWPKEAPEWLQILAVTAALSV